MPPRRLIFHSSCFDSRSTAPAKRLWMPFDRLDDDLDGRVAQEFADLREQLAQTLEQGELPWRRHRERHELAEAKRLLVLLHEPRDEIRREGHAVAHAIEALEVRVRPGPGGLEQVRGEVAGKMAIVDPAREAPDHSDGRALRGRLLGAQLREDGLAGQQRPRPKVCKRGHGVCGVAGKVLVVVRQAIGCLRVIAVLGRHVEVGGPPRAEQAARHGLRDRPGDHDHRGHHGSRAAGHQHGLGSLETVVDLIDERQVDALAARRRIDGDQRDVVGVSVVPERIRQRLRLDLAVGEALHLELARAFGHTRPPPAERLDEPRSRPRDQPLEDRIAGLGLRSDDDAQRQSPNASCSTRPLIGARSSARMRSP